MMLIRPGRRCSSASRLMALSMFRMRVLVMPIFFFAAPLDVPPMPLLLLLRPDAAPPLR